jgi:glucokinase
VAGLAEALFGAGKGLSPIFYITIGTGIGGGLIINGEIYRGIGRGAAEIGHVLIPDSLKTAYEPTEHFASGLSIQNTARQIARVEGLQPSSPLYRLVDGVVDRITTAKIAHAAELGDVFAQWVLDEAWKSLALAVCQMITLLSPRRIVIGGGVSLMGERLFFEPLRRLVAQQVFRPFADCYDIVPSALGEEVVVHGALALARRRLSS